MRIGKFWRLITSAILAAVAVVSCAGLAYAQTSSSSNYQVTQTEFGSSSTQQSCSDQYCAKTSVGDAAVGASVGTSGSASFGQVTSSEPMLEVIVDGGESNLGVLTTSKTAYKTTMVKIRNYLSSGYVLQITGDPPKIDKHTLQAPSTQTESYPGTEQFAINAVANTIPVVGANPVQVPSGDFSFGVVDDNYDNPNLFRYVSGDVVARSTKSSGETDYTISMIVNISNSTPAGHYAGDFAAVVVPVY